MLEANKAALKGGVSNPSFSMRHPALSAVEDLADDGVAFDVLG